MKRSELVIGGEYYEASSKYWDANSSYGSRVVVVSLEPWQSIYSYFGSKNLTVEGVTVAGRYSVQAYGIRKSDPTESKMGVLVVRLDRNSGEPIDVREGAPDVAMAQVAQLGHLRGPWGETSLTVLDREVKRWEEDRRKIAARNEHDTLRMEAIERAQALLGPDGERIFPGTGFTFVSMTYTALNRLLDFCEGKGGS